MRLAAEYLNVTHILPFSCPDMEGRLTTICLVGQEVVDNGRHSKSLSPEFMLKVGVVEHALNHVEDGLVESLHNTVELQCVQWRGCMNYTLV